MLKKYFSGLRFGLLLQIAVGPMCLMVFNTAKNVGFIVSLSLVLAIALVDAFYITLAGLGVSKVLEKEKTKKIFKIIGAMVLIVFGINIILNVFGINIIPGLNLKPSSAFVQGLVLTLSNPITIVFWGSILTTKIIEDNLKKKELVLFSIGLVSSTLIFLTLVAILGTILSSFIPEIISNILNVVVGLLIIFFGIKMLFKKEKINKNIKEENKEINNMVDQSIEKLINKCDLGNIKEKPSRVYGGLLNRMYKVNTDKGTYAIKLLNPEVMKRPDAKHNHIFAETVANIAKNNGIKCIPAKIINDKALQEIDGNFFFIYDWFEGKAIEDDEITTDKVKKVAKELAKLHQINFGNLIDECKLHYDLNTVDWKFYLDKIDNKEAKEVYSSNIDKLYELDKKSIDSLKKISKNLIISHRDLDLKNVLWDENDEPVFIDWESSSVINASMEVVDTAWNWSGGQEFFNKEKFKIFINTYKENGGNLNDFEDAIIADFKAKFGWLEYNLKRATGIECHDDEEKKLGESEVIRTIDEINKYDLYRKDF